LSRGIDRKYETKPSVDLKNSDVMISAEVLGKTTCVGIVRKSWFE